MKRMLKWLFAVVVCVVLGVILFKTAGVKAKEPARPSETRESDLAVDKDLVRADNKFGFNLFGKLQKLDAQKNIFISPPSVAIALSMTYNGAAGSTQAGMAETLCIGNMSLQKFNKANFALLDNMRYPGKAGQLEVANSLWVKQGTELKSEFINNNTRFYDAETKPLADAQAINDWASDKTHHKIKKVLEQVDPSELLYLVNAVYFKGEWADKFEPSQTHNDIFHLADGSKVDVPFMHSSGEYKYYANKSFQAIELPYGNKRISMYVFLPAKSSSLSTFCKSLTSDNWNNWIAQLHDAEGDLAMPKFKIEYKAEDQMKFALSDLGMAWAFKPGANFSKMCNDAPWISRVIHKTYVDVNEEGTEAAAVTAVGVAMCVTYQQRRFTQKIDRPFFFAIRDNKTRAILFMGNVWNPGKVL